MSPPNQRILGEKYRLVRQLDEGGMGAVWLAEHLSLHSPVAVKLLTQDIADSEEGVQRFLREARAAASLRSPHVVQILDYGVENNGVEDARPYIVMELLEGESLAQRLARVQRLSPQQTTLVFRHVARAVARAHDAGIVHRDLKPSNVFITDNEDEELIKLLDFGIAKAALDVLGASIAGNTRTGAFLGTPYYVSPEQAEGSKSLDYRTDIWSLGVIAYECLIGRLPFFGETFGSLVLSICSRPMPVPSQNGQVPAGFDEWFARACARDVEQRFQSVREAASCLRQLLEPGAAEHSQSAPALAAAAQSSPAAKLETEAVPSLPVVPHLGDTTAVASSAAITRRRPAPRRLRIIAGAGLGALALLAGVAAIRLSGTRSEPPVAASLTASALAPLAPTPALLPEPGAVPPVEPRAVPPVEPRAVLRRPGDTAAANGAAAGPNVAPVREPPAVAAAAPEPSKASPPRTRSPSSAVAKSKPSPPVPAQTRPASAASKTEHQRAETGNAAPPAGPLKAGPLKAGPLKAGPQGAALMKPEPPPAAPAKEPSGKHGVNLGI